MPCTLVLMQYLDLQEHTLIFVIFTCQWPTNYLYICMHGQKAHGYSSIGMLVSHAMRFEANTSNFFAICNGLMVLTAQMLGCRDMAIFGLTTDDR